jgi:hypothetical protein
MSGRECPDCQWTPPDSGHFYYYTKPGIRYCTFWCETSNRIYGKPPRGKKSYPIYSDMSENYMGERNWDETHFCPNCEEEFSFSDGDH